MTGELTIRAWLRLGVAMAAGLPLLLPFAARADAPATSVVVHGRGDGHGVGLPQDGALALGRSGMTAAQILATFYPGTTLQSDRSAEMHVAVWQSGTASTSTSQVSLPTGGQVSGAKGSLAVPPGGILTLSPVGGVWVARLASVPVVGTGGRSLPRTFHDDPAPDPSSTASMSSAAPDPQDPTTAQSPVAASPVASSPPQADPGPGSTAPSGAVNGEPTGLSSADPGPGAGVGTILGGTPATKSAGPVPSSDMSAPTVLSGTRLEITPDGTGVTDILSTGRSYRGEIFTAPGELVNDVPLELYLRGLGEVRDPSWPQAGLQAVIIAARTYALRDALGAEDPGDPQQVNICATDACQVYLGAGVEYPQLTQAVATSTGEVLEWQGALASTYYSASAGGETATPTEGFGAGATDLPYLTPVSYDDGGRDGWQRTIDLGAAATAFHYPGRLTQIEVTGRGPSGRATTILLHGTTGDVPTTGVELESALGLPSTLFTTGFGIDAPQVDAATTSATLPALTAASLGQVAVPLPIIAPTPVASATSPAPAAVESTGTVAATQPRTVASVTSPIRLGLVVCLGLLVGLPLLALLRQVVPTLARRRRSRGAPRSSGEAAVAVDQPPATVLPGLTITAPLPSVTNRASTAGVSRRRRRPAPRVVVVSSTPTASGQLTPAVESAITRLRRG